MNKDMDVKPWLLQNQFNSLGVPMFIVNCNCNCFDGSRPCESTQFMNLGFTFMAVCSMLGCLNMIEDGSYCTW